MKKNNYSAPQLEQVRMEAEMPVMAGSGVNDANLGSYDTRW